MASHRRFSPLCPCSTLTTGRIAGLVILVEKQYKLQKFLEPKNEKRVFKLHGEK
jgi:hypothetical protein